MLRTEAHTLGAHGLSENDFYTSGILEGAVQRIRGQISSKMFSKRDFMKRVLNHMQDGGHITDWEPSGGKNRHDYTVKMPSGRIVVIESKGCLDGNNTNIFERPEHAEEFVIWSICSNGSADPRHNVWSGIHARLSAEEIHTQKKVDGLIVWDWLCGTVERPCPKLKRGDGRITTVGPYQLTPPCIYIFPKTVPSVKNNPNPEPHALSEVTFLKALNDCFGGYLDELNKVRFFAAHKGESTVRTTSIERDGELLHTSKPNPIKRKG